MWHLVRELMVGVTMTRVDSVGVSNQVQTQILKPMETLRASAEAAKTAAADPNLDQKATRAELEGKIADTLATSTDFNRSELQNIRSKLMDGSMSVQDAADAICKHVDAQETRLKSSMTDLGAAKQLVHDEDKVGKLQDRVSDDQKAAGKYQAASSACVASDANGWREVTTALGTLGVGLPFALAAQAARPGDRVVVFIGDGSFGLSAMEIDTAVRHKLPVVVVVSNNAGWGDVRHEQDAAFGEGRHVASELHPTRYDRFAAAFGAHGEHVERLEELRPALDRSLESGVCSVIDVSTDPAVLSELLRMVATLGLM